MGFWKKITSAFKAVAKVALVVVAIVAPELIPAIGSAILPAGASAVAATAAGSAVITTAGQLAAGASPEQAIKAGAIAGVSMGAGGSVAASTGSVAAGSVAGSAAGTVVAGGSAQDVLKNAVSAGIGAGVGEVGLDAGLSPSTAQAVGKGAGVLTATGGNVDAALKTAINSAVSSELGSLAKQGVDAYKASADTKLAELQTTPEQQAAAGAQQLVETAKATPGTQVAQADTGTTTDVQAPLLTGVPGQKDTGEIVVTATQPTAGAIDVMPYLQTGVSKTTPSATSRAPSTTQTIDRLSEVKVTAPPEVAPTSDKQPVAQEPAKQAEPTKEAEAPKKPTLSPIYFTGVTPPLAQALGTSFTGGAATTGISTGLAGERGAGELESKETGKERKNVWNEASLRLKDALGV